MSRIHAERDFGKFAEGIPVDRQGHTFTTAEEWALVADLDWGPGFNPDDDWEPFWQHCNVLAYLANRQITRADRELARWQIQHAGGHYIIPKQQPAHRLRLTETA